MIRGKFLRPNSFVATIRKTVDFVLNASTKTEKLFLLFIQLFKIQNRKFKICFIRFIQVNNELIIFWTRAFSRRLKEVITRVISGVISECMQSFNCLHMILSQLR